ncbi:MAG TPA: hypothetical protein VFB04_16110 [Terriglobales bacterium]|nr:hypothetical protein [Terriglobales bacterium]
MTCRTGCICAVVALAVAMGSAQTKTTMTGKCNKPDVRQSVPAGDQQGHVFMVAQGQCTITASLNGAVAKQGNFSEELEGTSTNMNNRGIYTVTFDSGDKAYFKYQGSGTMKDGAMQTATNKWEIIGGTGKMQGINGTGGCKLTGNKDGGVDYSCTGTYHMGMPTGNNSRGKGRTTPVQR